MKLLVVKQWSNKGFTCIEMLFVLFIIVILLCTSMFMSSKSIKLQYQMQILQQLLLKAQTQAIITKKKVTVVVEEEGVWIQNEYYDFMEDMQCNPYRFHYAQSGNISKGGKIQCAISHKQKTLVMQVGSGQIDIR